MGCLVPRAATRQRQLKVSVRKGGGGGGYFVVRWVLSNGRIKSWTRKEL